MSKGVVVKRTKKKVARRPPGQRQMAAGEFKAKCLGVLDEVQDTGRHIVITKRGKPVAKVVPITDGKRKDNFLGRLEGIMKINGDPDDLVNPIFPLEDWDMLK
ncbi:MAG TPA: type II toxin-antitoxin system prevent-host-death family antitoxin [Candidatus Limnocylindrales bacterium]|nr:type II toxin-antitoxin system prevent-host-death family antitoxin [Candidatus Limnocylindrales bacterium]